jgi:hypothetical protein
VLSPASEVAGGNNFTTNFQQLFKSFACWTNKVPACVQQIYEKINFNTVGRPAGQRGPWFATGVANVEMNDWSGSVSYRGTTVAPDYVMQNKSGESVRGTLGQQALTNLSGTLALAGPDSATVGPDCGRELAARLKAKVLKFLPASGFGN